MCVVSGWLLPEGDSAFACCSGTENCRRKQFQGPLLRFVHFPPGGIGQFRDFPGGGFGIAIVPNQTLDDRRRPVRSLFIGFRKSARQPADVFGRFARAR